MWRQTKTTTRYQSHNSSQSGSQVKTPNSRTKAQEESLTAAVNHHEEGVRIQSQSKCLSFSWRALNNSAEVAAPLSSAETFRNLGATSSKDSVSLFTFSLSQRLNEPPASRLEEQVAPMATRSGFVGKHIKSVHEKYFKRRIFAFDLIRKRHQWKLWAVFCSLKRHNVSNAETKLRPLCSFLTTAKCWPAGKYTYMYTVCGVWWGSKSRWRNQSLCSRLLPLPLLLFFRASIWIQTPGWMIESAAHNHRPAAPRQTPSYLPVSLYEVEGPLSSQGCNLPSV